MKKHVKILMIMLICFFCALLSSCGFVRYVRYEDDSLEATKKEYMAYIKALEDKNNYFEEEKREYIKNHILIWARFKYMQMIFYNLPYIEK